MFQLVCFSVLEHHGSMCEVNYTPLKVKPGGCTQKQLSYPGNRAAADHMFHVFKNVTLQKLYP